MLAQFGNKNVSNPWQLALIGFSSFERTALASCLRLSVDPQPHCVIVDQVDQADLLIADTDAAQVLQLLRSAKRLDTTLAVGQRPLEGCLAQLPRPINPLMVVRTVGRLLASRTPNPRAAIAPAANLLPQTVVATSNAAAVDAAARQRSILVVDPDPLVLRFMASHLVRFGFEVRLARTGEDALTMVAKQPFAFVFVERTLPGLDGWQTCKLIKQAQRRSTERPTRVVMVTEIDNHVDRMRVAVAGYDAYLRKPLQHDALMAVVGDQVVANAGSAQTAYAPMTSY